MNHPRPARGDSAAAQTASPASLHWTAALTVAVIGFAIGYFVSDDSWELAELRSELAQRSTAARQAPNRSTESLWNGAARFRNRSLTNSPAISAADWPPEDEFFRSLNITKEEWDQTMDLNRRSSAGEYVLKNERPATKRFLEHDFTKIVSGAADRTGPEYDSVFGELGVPPEAAEQLKTHVTKIHKASLEAEVAMSQLLHARQDYDKRLRSTLSDENYQRYRHLEESKPASWEFDRLRKYAAQENLAISPEYDQKLTDLIREAQAYTTVSWHGPFDGLPQPVLGIENVAEAEAQRTARIRANAELVLNRAAGQIPEDYRDLIASYYSEQVRKILGAVEQIRSDLSAVNQPIP